MAKITTITNPLTGQPAQVDQLEHTAQQIDDGLDIARGVSNPNLLDNWYFGNPVNQRGQTSYTGAVYGIDRWKSFGGTVTLESDGLIVNNSICQILKDKTELIGKTVTFSVLVESMDGTAKMDANGHPFGTDFQLNTGLNSVTFIVSSATLDGIYPVIGATGNIKIKAAKLELGTTQTLAHQDENGNWVLNEIPDYGEQLARCQRYYYDSGFGRVNESDGAYSVALTTSITYLIGNYRFPVTMRVKPSITIYSVHGTANRISYWASAKDVDKPVEPNNLTVGVSGFNAVQAATAFEPGAYAFHIVANAEL